MLEVLPHPQQLSQVYAAKLQRLPRPIVRERSSPEGLGKPGVYRYETALLPLLKELLNHVLPSIPLITGALALPSLHHHHLRVPLVLHLGGQQPNSLHRLSIQHYEWILVLGLLLLLWLSQLKRHIDQCPHGSIDSSLPRMLHTPHQQAQPGQ